MNNITAWAWAIALLAVVLFHPQKSFAQGFTGKIIIILAAAMAGLMVSGLALAQENSSFKSSEFLTWKRANQEFYIDTAIGMAILIADQNDKGHGKCVGDWYGNNPNSAYEDILEAMRRFPEYHPRGVILAVAEKRCGEFSYK